MWSCQAAVGPATAPGGPGRGRVLAGRSCAARRDRAAKAEIVPPKRPNDREWAYMVMAYLVMAYIVMAYIVMAHIVMAHIVMAPIVMAHISSYGPYRHGPYK